jgi:thioredoxin-related protein
MRPLHRLLASLVFPLLTGVAFASGSEWHADFDAAQKEAQRTGKDLLVDFTGSDWCGWCIRLDKEVFQHDEFDAGTKDFVLVALDFPNGDEAKAKVPNPARNEALKEQHGIQGFPTILLMTAQGEVYGQTGYQKGGPAAYVEHLGELRTNGKQQLAAVKAAIAAYGTASGDAKLAAWDAIADQAEKLEADSPFAGLLVEPLEAGLALDAATQQARRLRAAGALITLGRASDATARAVRELDPKNEHGLLERELAAQFRSVHDDETARAAIDALTAFEAAAKFKDAQLRLDLYTSMAQWLAGPLDDAAAAKAWAEKALALEPKDERVRAALKEIAGG